ncbi:uncharacterized protein LOC132053985 [Lycium ferocissimum]|uniref:uncharacterized protein LOC132053985 n=1 Tax=Lycium ferocissimum TaxID=112874 RepID=UPI00281600A4|nr:uncharacterized protein LOC132053985 [Lycium ferocissimum]
MVKSLKQINSTVISLIPKVTAPEWASQFRPISCCNIIYKCIAKLLCLRMKKALNSIVAENQAAFVEGRSLIQNVLICHDLLRHCNRKTSSRCLMKIDLRKAYDIVSWDFIEEALKGFGFPDSFRKLIMVCVTTTKFSVKVNGVGHGYFEGKRGLRQGDPISPLLFVLVMEYLSRVLSKMSELPDFRYHPMCKATKLTHLIFADDLMIFCKGNLKSVSRVMEALSPFSKVTGLVANLDKSNIFLAGVDDNTQQEILNRTRFFIGSLPIKYLGLPLTSKKWNSMDCQQLVDQITSRIKGASEEKRKVAMVAWDKVCVPKKNGGLNIKRCNNWNIASVGKLLWQLAGKKDILWVKWVNGIYMKADVDIWVHTPPGDCSWYWKKLNSLKSQMQGWYQNNRYTLTTTGDYSVSSSYQALLGPRPRLSEADIIWNSVMLPKQRMIVWLACKERLLTKERLTKLNIHVVDQKCCLCDGTRDETPRHLFADCSWITNVRVALSTWLGITIQSKDVYNTIKWIKRRRWRRVKKETVSEYGEQCYTTRGKLGIGRFSNK